MIRKMFFVAVVVGVVALAMPMAALAVQFGVNVFVAGDPNYGGAGGVTILDNTAFDGDSAVGVIDFHAGQHGAPVISGINLAADLSFTNVPGGSPSSFVDINWTLSSAEFGQLGISAGNTVIVTASATGFTFPPGGSPATLTSDIGGTITGTGSVSAKQWANLENLLFGKGPITPGLQGPFTTSSFGDSESKTFVVTGDYSITDELDLTVARNSSTTGDLNSNVTTPEPGILILLGIGLSAVGVFSRRIKF